MKNLKISTKLTILIVVFVTGMLIEGVFSVLSLRNVNQGVETMYNDRIVPLQQLKAVSDAYAVNIVDAINMADDGKISWEQALSKLENATETVKTNWNAYLNTKIEGHEAELVEKADKARDEYSLPTFKKAVSILSKEKDSTSQAELHEFIANELYEGITPFTSVVDELMKEQLEISKHIKENSQKAYNATLINTVVVVFLILLLAILLAYLIIVNINRSLNKANKTVESLSAGDFTVQIEADSKDEIGTLLKNMKSMVSKLTNTISTVRGSSQQITSGANEMSSSAQEISQGANEQASSIEEISSAIEEMTATINQNTEQALKAQKTSEMAAENIKTSSDVVIEAVNAMKNIADKISVISEIADKTDLLAINAAVEAARAGEQGRGFAVVATEIRKLAENTQNAAKEIELLTKSSVKVADEAGNKLQTIVPEILDTAKLVSEISTASIEQNSSANEISNSIQQFNGVTQQSAASTEELASSIEELTSQAEMLLEIVSFFKVEKNLSSNNFARTTNYQAQKPKKKNINFHSNDNLDSEFETF